MSYVRNARHSGDIVERAYPEVGAGGFSRVDGTVQFYVRVGSLIGAETVLLDFGAGRGGHVDDPVPLRRQLRNLRGRVARVIGVDVDPAVLTNPEVDEALVIAKDGHIPLGDMSVDVIVADYVFEHIKYPLETSAELRRVLRPGGWICVRTVNRWNYIAVASRLLGDTVGRRIVGLMQPKRLPEDVFQAYYQLNTKRRLGECFPEFDVFAYGYDAEPAYHAGSVVLFNIFRMMQYLSPSPMKTTLIAFLRKR